MFLLRLAVCIPLLVFSLQLVTAEWINEHVKVSTNAKTFVSQTVSEVRIRNIGPQHKRTVRLSLRCVDAEPNDMPLVQESRTLVKPFISLAVKRIGQRSWREKSEDSAVCYVEFEVSLSKSLGKDDSIDLVILWNSVNAITPSPKEIHEDESQYVQLRSNAYFFSPYKTKHMELEVSVPNNDITSFPSDPDPVTIAGSKVKFGPYINLPPYADKPVVLRFKNDRGFLVADEAIREMYISHWGNVAVKESFYIRNNAARQIGGWSRADYSRNEESSYPTAIRDVWAWLPQNATNVIYKDLVGNITTSRLRKPNGKYRPLQLQFRFPLLGGWKNRFWYAYDVPLEDFARSKGSRYVVKCPVFPSVHQRFLVRKLTIRVMLPEGASEVVVPPHQTIQLHEQETVERTTLNYFGRKVITLTAENVYSRGSIHDRHVVITYSFPTVGLLASPAIVIVGIFGLFISYIAYANSGLVLVQEIADPVSRSKLLAEEQVLRIAEECQRIADLFGELDLLFAKCTSAGSLSNVMAARMKIEKEMKNHENEISHAVTQLKTLWDDKAVLANAILQRYANKRDACMRIITSRKMFLEGDMTKKEYTAQVEEKLYDVVQTVSRELSVLITALTDEV